MPDDFKKAVITPLPKKPSALLEYTNYRPVSNLPFVSKVVERAVVDQFGAFCQENGLEEPMQSAYKKYHCTESALLKVHNDILMNMDKKRTTLLVLLDMSAAFDTVNDCLLYTSPSPRDS